MDIFRDISVSPFERRLARLATMLALGDNLGGGGAKNAPPPLSQWRSAEGSVRRRLISMIWDSRKCILSLNKSLSGYSVGNAIIFSIGFMKKTGIRKGKNGTG